MTNNEWINQLPVNEKAKFLLDFYVAPNDEDGDLWCCKRCDCYPPPKDLSTINLVFSSVRCPECIVHWLNAEHK